MAHWILGGLILSVHYVLLQYFKPDGLYWQHLTEYLNERDKRIVKAFQNNKDHKGHNVL